MNSSPSSNPYSHTHYSTPSRKPSEHHCMADRKMHPHAQISTQSLAPLCRILFQDSDFSSHTVSSVNTKLLRWLWNMIIYMSLSLFILWLFIINEYWRLHQERNFWFFWEKQTSLQPQWILLWTLHLVIWTSFLLLIQGKVYEEIRYFRFIPKAGINGSPFKIMIDTIVKPKNPIFYYKIVENIEKDST